MLSLRRIFLPVGWIDQSSESDKCVRLCKLKNLPLDSNQPVVVELCSVVNTDRSWSVYTCGCCLGSSTCNLLENVPDYMTPECLSSVVKLLDGCNICIGHPDAQYCELAKSRKGVFKDSSGKTVKATLDTNHSSVHVGTTRKLCVPQGVISLFQVISFFFLLGESSF